MSDEWAFRVVSALVALDYIVLAVACVRVVQPVLRLRTMVSSTRSMAVLTLVALTAFFAAATYTNARLAIDPPDPHWINVVGLIMRVIQASAGAALVLLTRRHIVVRVYDRHTYERVTFDPAGVEERLRYLALQEGLKVR